MKKCMRRSLFYYCFSLLSSGIKHICILNEARSVHYKNLKDIFIGTCLYIMTDIGGPSATVFPLKNHKRKREDAGTQSEF